MIDRKGNRSWDQLRMVKIEQNYLRHHPGSVLIETGAFDRTQLAEMTELASRGIQDLNLIQREILRDAI
ncbi:MAG: hypothetical protein QMD32_06930 [Smithellaceae bacterium]|nr:hypothetical protein [Smithellaceae bacterium]